MTIYTPLLNEETDCWRPIEAEALSGNRYRILTERPDGEVWPFATGQIVMCEEKTFSIGKPGLVVVSVA